MKNIAVVLSGCGHQDGAEVTETVAAIVTLSQLGAAINYFAPNMEVNEVNHLVGKETGQKRNLLVEGARIARGKIKDLKELSEKHFDGLVFPGGKGASLNLCDFAAKGAKASLHPEVSRIVMEFHRESKPIAAICIAPVLLALALGKKNVEVTIGNDKKTSVEIEKLGAKHIDCPVDDFITDRNHKVVTTPAYMYGNAKPYDVFLGIQKTIREFYEMA
ncbi:MAG: isoprenoid biosynthesis protein ElbB [Proteobacteria bacterium SG_bin7]|nr:MAG: isoprenoid biosynthesis protein ElbB [Proteobacteria bacterium SG_bin7]